MFATYALAWLGLVILAVVNGVARDKVYGKRLGELWAHQVSTLIFLVIIGLYTAVLRAIRPIPASGQALAVGLMWLGMTLAFEFLAGHYLFKTPWSRLWHDYNVFKGRIWVLIPIWTLLAPLTIRGLMN